MSERPEGRLLAHLEQGLRGTFLEGQLILGGSSGLFGFATKTPAFTEDLDFLIREDLVASRGAEIVEILARLGYERRRPSRESGGRPSTSWATPLRIPRTTSRPPGRFR